MKKNIHLHIFLLLLLMAVGSGCELDNRHTLRTRTFHSIGSQDGIVASGVAISSQAQARIGDNTGNSGARGIVSFYLGDLLYDVETVVSATLRVYQTDVSNDPYGSLGNVKVDSIDTSIFSQDMYNVAKFITLPDSLSTTADTGWKELDVTPAVSYDINNLLTSPYSRFRIYQSTTTDNDGVEDASIWCMGEDANYPPELVIQYYD